MRTLYVTVNRNRIASNRKWGRSDPVLRVCSGIHGCPEYYDEYEATGIVRVRYRPDTPLPCGARAWIEIEPLPIT